ncbi:hypothetical protein RQW99_08315 [Leuconostoc falkenbergense]|uniref:hypothetical protein n=1 Tax=Leuconostoc falkenbergense TaxID=2766470 RepID=UPI0021A9F3C5|nr:hypothetical protein [Leuconostoc falkenbergense]MDY5164537.1 hypothetical protein [Leuconostoc falkenbergense]
MTDRDLIAKIERLKGDVININTEIPSSHKMVKQYGKDVVVMLNIMIGRLSNVHEL